MIDFSALVLALMLLNPDIKSPYDVIITDIEIVIHGQIVLCTICGKKATVFTGRSWRCRSHQINPTLPEDVLEE